MFSVSIVYTKTQLDLASKKDGICSCKGLAIF